MSDLADVEGDESIRERDKHARNMSGGDAAARREKAETRSETANAVAEKRAGAKAHRMDGDTLDDKLRQLEAELAKCEDPLRAAELQYHLDIRTGEMSGQRGSVSSDEYVAGLEVRRDEYYAAGNIPDAESVQRDIDEYKAQQERDAVIKRRNDAEHTPDGIRIGDPAPIYPELKWRVDDKGNPTVLDAATSAANISKWYGIRREVESDTYWIFNGTGRHYMRLSDSDLRRLIALVSKRDDVNARQRDMIFREVHDQPTTPDTRENDWDTAGDVVHFRNGTLHLNDMRFDDKVQRDRLNKFALDVEYDPKARPAPEFYKYLASTFDSDPERITALLECMAQAINQQPPVEKFYVLTGPQNTGKSTALHILEALYARHHIAHMSMQLLGDKHGGEGLEGKALCLTFDMSTERKVGSVALLKAAVSRETIGINPKGRPPYDFRPTALCVFAMNGLPTLPENDAGLNERMVIVQFMNSFDRGDSRRIEGLRHILTAPNAMSGLANLLVWRLRILRRTHETAYTKTPREVYAEYQDIENGMGEFKKWVEFDGVKRTPHEDIRAAYETCCAGEGIIPISPQKFNSWLRANKCVDVHTRGGKGSRRVKAWQGIGFTDFGRGRLKSVVDGAAGTLDAHAEDTTPASTPASPPSPPAAPEAAEPDTSEPPPEMVVQLVAEVEDETIRLWAGDGPETGRERLIADLCVMARDGKSRADMLNGVEGVRYGVSRGYVGPGKPWKDVSVLLGDINGVAKGDKTVREWMDGQAAEHVKYAKHVEGPQ